MNFSDIPDYSKRVFWKSEKHGCLVLFKDSHVYLFTIFSTNFSYLPSGRESQPISL